MSSLRLGFQVLCHFVNPCRSFQTWFPSSKHSIRADIRSRIETFSCESLPWNQAEGHTNHVLSSGRITEDNPENDTQKLELQQALAAGSFGPVVGFSYFLWEQVLF